MTDAFDENVGELAQQEIYTAWTESLTEQLAEIDSLSGFSVSEGLQTVGQFNYQADDKEGAEIVGRDSLLQKAAYGLCNSAMIFQLSPGNEAARVAVLGAVGAALDGKSLIVGAAYGAATTVIESAGVMAAAYALDRPDMKGVTRLFDKAADKMGIHEGDKVSTPLQMAATFLGGAGVSLFLRDRAVVGGRSWRDNVKYGLMASGALGAVCTVQGAALDSGIDAPGLGTIGMAAGAVASVVGTVRWAKSYTHKTKETDTKSQITIDNTRLK